MITNVNTIIDSSFPVDNQVYSELLFILISDILFSYIGDLGSFSLKLS